MRISNRHAALGAVVIFLSYAGWLVIGQARGYPTAQIDDLLSLAISLIPLAFALQAARLQRGRPRAAWLALAAGLVCWTIGEAIWTYREITHQQVDRASIADLFYFAFSAAAVVALLLFWKRHGIRAQGRVVLDGLIVAASLFAASWALGMGRLYEAEPANRLEFIVSMAYPISDIVVVTVATLVVISASPGQRRFLGLLTAGLTLSALADSAYAYLSAQNEYASGNLIDLGWAAALLLIAVAAAIGRTAPDDRHSPDELPGWASVWLPYMPLMLAAGALAVAPVVFTTARPILVVGSFLIVAVLARQYLAVDQNRRLIAAVTDQALHDPLTGLANRTMFAEELDRALATQEAARAAVGVIVVDLDDFKLINDTLGHGAGDDLLRATGQRVLACVRSGDTVARIGGDEFAAVLSGEAPLLEAVADRVVEAFNQPVAVAGQELLMRPSVGLAVMSPADPDISAEELLRRADLAMYAAKRSRTAKARTYTADLEQLASSEAVRRLGDERRSTDGAAAVRMLAELRDAVDAGDLTLVYQPKLNLEEGSVVGLEALLRWPHPERGLLMPEAFLPLVHRHALTGAVTNLVLHRALDDARRWRAEGLELPVAVNLFPQSLAMSGLAQQIDRALADRGLSPRALTVELTEDLLLGDIGLARQVLVQLRDRGIRVSIDHFGSGYSALWYLRDLPVDEVKLDHDFIAPIITDPRAAAVVLAVLDLARVLDIATVAEGVDNEATAAALRHFGCDMVQGAYFSAPLTAAEVPGRCAGRTLAPVPSGGDLLLE